MTGDEDDAVSQIVTRRGAYIVPRKHALTWQERYPGSTPPAGYEDHKFWPTPEGLVFARPDKDE